MLAARFGAKAVCATGFALITLSFLGFQLLDADSPLWLLLAILSVQGVGMGSVMAPATESIMSVVPREKAGAGAAVNNSVRQVGGALGVAILGSVLAAAYAAHLGDATDALPASAREQADESIVGHPRRRRPGAGRTGRRRRPRPRRSRRAGPGGVRRRHAHHRGGDGGRRRDRRRRRAGLAAGPPRSGDGPGGRGNRSGRMTA